MSQFLFPYRLRTSVANAAPNRRSARRLLPLVASLVLLLLLAACAAPIVAPAADESAVAESPVAQDASAGSAATDTEPAAATAPVAEEAASGEEYNGMAVGFTAEGHPYRGNPDAPVVMNEFSDFQCPFCARYFVQTEPAINEAYVQTGQLQVVFRDLPLVDLHPNAPAAHVASTCVAEQSASLFWAMHDELFSTQTLWSNAIDPAPEFLKLVERIGADTTAYNNCMGGMEAAAIVQSRLDAGLGLGFDGTPSFLFTAGEDATYTLVGAQPFEQFSQMIDALVAGETPASAQQPASEGDQSIPEWASPEGRAVDPNRLGYTVYGDQTRGDPDAPIVIVEFSDFQCPFCKRHVTETQPVLDADYVDTGKVRFIYKHFPLPIHPQAPAAGIAAECADEQGEFWTYSALLFEDIEAWSIEDPNPIFAGLAEDLALDVAAFEACLLDPAMAERVAVDLTEGRSYVEGTPTFIVLWETGGRIIPGALPVSAFSAELDRILTEELGG